MCALGSCCGEPGSSGSAASSPAREAGSSNRGDERGAGGDERGANCKLGGEVVFFPNRPFYDKSTRSQCNEGAGGAELTHALRQGEARGGDSAESARTSLSKGDSPSTLAVLGIGKESKLAAKDLAAATDNNPDHRPTKAAIVAARCRGRAARARARANNRTKLAASALQRPPTSMPRTTKRHRDARPNSG